MTAINLFKDLGKLIDRQIKEKITDKGKRRKQQDKDSLVEKHLIVDDNTIAAMPFSM